jgi:hypothetical protein
MPPLRGWILAVFIPPFSGKSGFQAHRKAAPFQSTIRSSPAFPFKRNRLEP